MRALRGGQAQGVPAPSGSPSAACSRTVMAAADHRSYQSTAPVLVDVVNAASRQKAAWALATAAALRARSPVTGEARPTPLARYADSKCKALELRSATVRRIRHGSRLHARHARGRPRCCSLYAKARRLGAFRAPSVAPLTLVAACAGLLCLGTARFGRRGCHRARLTNSRRVNALQRLMRGPRHVRHARSCWRCACRWQPWLFQSALRPQGSPAACTASERIGVRADLLPKAATLGTFCSRGCSTADLCRHSARLLPSRTSWMQKPRAAERQR